MQICALILSLFLLPILMLSSSIRSTMLLPILTIIIFLLVNAFVVSTFSGVAPRYQTRIVWVLPFVILLCLAQLIKISIHNQNTVKLKHIGC